MFVDGENLRHSLIAAFAAEGLFEANDYLPTGANWSDFFDWVVEAATRGSRDRLRAYWFVTQEMDCFPYGLGKLMLPGGARRLNIVTDASLSVPYEKLRNLMGLGSTTLPSAANE